MTAFARIRHCRCCVGMSLTLRCVTHPQLDFVRGWWAPHFKKQNRPVPLSPRGFVATSGLSPGCLPALSPPVALSQYHGAAVASSEIPCLLARPPVLLVWTGPWLSLALSVHTRLRLGPQACTRSLLVALLSPPGTLSSRVQVAGRSRVPASEPAAETPARLLLDLPVSAGVLYALRPAPSLAASLLVAGMHNHSCVSAIF